MAGRLRTDNRIHEENLRTAIPAQAGIAPAASRTAHHLIVAVAAVATINIARYWV